MQLDPNALPDGWRPVDDTIRARYLTNDFATGLSLVQQIGDLAEAANHHPDVTLTFPAVTVVLTSHDAGGVTDRDLALAGQIAELVTQRGVGVDVEREHEVSIWVPASPADVYAVVSDVTRTGEWSPTCRGAEWTDPNHTGEGATFQGHNDNGQRQWTSTSKVTVADPGRRFEWEVNDGVARWGYTLTPHADGTLLTHTWRLTAHGHRFFLENRPEPMAQMAQREASARNDMPITLARIARIVA